MSWRPDPPGDRQRHKELGRYLLDGEHVLTAVHQHWAKIAEPFLSVIGGLFLVLALDSWLPRGFGTLANLLWVAWIAVVVRAVWLVLEWRHDWFVATDKRLILTVGLITHKVAMMPLAKVTDMSYNRSPLGRLLGYGTFVMESAGQEQALHTVQWVANPDHTYRAICAEIFDVEDHERVFDQEAPDDHAPPPRSDPSSPLPTPYVGYVPSQPRRSAQKPAAGESVTHDPTPDAVTREAERRDADTGPIHYWRPGGTDEPIR